MSDLETDALQIRRCRRSETRQRTSTVSTRLLPVERQVIDTAAEATGLAVATWAREALLAAARAPVPPRKAVRTELAKAIGSWTGQVGKIGNLLNQMAVHAHQGGRVDPRALDNIRASVLDLHAAVIARENGGSKAGAA